MLPGGEALLRAQLEQRLDALLRQANAAVAPPQPTRAVAPVSNDTRLQSRALLDRQAQGGPLVATAREAQHQDAAHGATARGDGAAATQLSATARALATLLDPQAPTEPAPVRAAAPLWPRPSPPTVPELARALAHAVEGSGLFYESHLQQFANGMRTLAELQQEPQARLPAAEPAPASAPATSASHAAILHPATVEVVQQQLQLLASGVFRWCGEPWPGARMEWELHEEAAGGEPAVDRADRAWTTKLRVVLATFGSVDATLRLDASGLHVIVNATDGGALLQLQAGREALMQRFNAAGFAVRGCRVEAA